MSAPMAGSSPLVTVVTVTYNAEAFIEQTIKSVLQQDYSNIEYIIIDGGSTDGTMKIVEKYSHRIARYVSEPDEGIYDAMNKSIEMATGDLMNFMNAGDTFFDADTVGRIVSAYTPGTDVIYGDRVLIGPGAETYEKALPLESFYRQMPFGHQSAFVKTSLMKQHRYDTQYRLSADYDLLLKLYHRKCSFHYSGIPVCRFLLEGRSHTGKVFSSFEALKVLERYVDGPEALESSFFMQNLADSYNARRSHDTELMLLRTNTALFNRYFKALQGLVRLPQRYVIYGHAEIGKAIYELMPEKVVAFLDRKSDATGERIVPGGVYRPESIKNMEFDKIIISVLGREEEIAAYLTGELSVEAHKIMTLDI